MDWDRIEGNWKQLTGKVKKQWGDITDDDIAKIKGDRDELIGVLQNRYGYAKDRARSEVDRWAVSADAALAGAERGLTSVGVNFDTAIRKSLRDQPVPTLLAAAFVGFAVGAIWKM